VHPPPPRAITGEGGFSLRGHDVHPVLRLRLLLCFIGEDLPARHTGREHDPVHLTGFDHRHVQPTHGFIARLSLPSASAKRMSDAPLLDNRHPVVHVTIPSTVTVATVSLVCIVPSVLSDVTDASDLYTLGACEPD